MIVLRQLWALPYEGFSASRLFDVEAARAIFAEALFQGGVQLLMTVAVLWALPRILVRHAVYIAVASVIFRFVVSSVEAQLLGPMQTNGEHLQSVAATYVVVLVVCSIIVRRKLPVAPKIAGST